MVNLIQAHGGSPQKQPRYTPIFMDRAFTGLYTQRAVLHDPSDIYTSRYYGGRPDALLGGRNVELTNRLTLQRRPGLVPFRTTPGSGAKYATAPDRAFSFQLSDGTIQVIIDTADSGALTVTSCANASGGNTVYTGTFPGGDQTGGQNGYAGLTFVVAGFIANPLNNGTFVCVSSTTTTLTLANPNGISESHAATADTAGGVYFDKQDGTATLLFAKSPGATQTSFISVAGVLYMGDGVDTRKYTPLNTNGTLWNWGITAPTKQPGVALTPSGAAATQWQANTNFTTMGLTLDSTNHIVWQLISVNADGSQSATAQFGTAGNGEPDWPTSEGSTLVDGSVTWVNVGAVSPILPNTFYTDLGFAASAVENFSQPGAGTAVNTVYGNYKNSGNLGNTGSTLPAFSGAYPGPTGGYFNNNTHWFAIGSFNTSAQMTAMRWKASHAYSGWAPTGSANSIAGTPGFILTGNLPAPAGNKVYIFIPKVGGTSSSGYNPFRSTAVAGDTVNDGQLTWLCLGSSVWQASHAYTPWTAQGTSFGCVHDGANFQVCTKSSGTGLTGTHIPGTSITAATSITVTNTSTTTTFTRNAGSWSYTPVAGEQISTSGFANAVNNGLFTVVSATSNTIVVNVNTGTGETAAAGVITLNPWATGYGGTTVDGGITWTCVGQDVPWVAGSSTTGIWHLPTVGFQPPGPSEQFGGSEVNASGFVQAVTNSGTSAATPPTWPTTVGGTVTETGSAPKPTWQTAAAISSQSLAWSFGLCYAYSYKARPLTDSFSPTPLGGGLIPPGSVSLGVPFGSQTNAISSASPVNQIVGANTGSVNTISGDYCSDPQCDTIVIWRSADTASGSNSMFELTEIPNVPALAGSKQWSFQDALPSVANGTFPGLNVLLPAPVDGVNNPPLSNFKPQVYNFQRIWCVNGQNVNFSGGPDTAVGNPNEAFNIADQLPFLAPVTRLVRTPQGIVTFLTDSIEIIGGGPATATFFSVTMAPGIGLLSYNACDVFAGEIYFFAADNTFRVISPALNLSQFGFPIGDQLANNPAFGSSDATWDPTKVYVAVHQNGTDNCIFLADGSTGWYRLNPHQVPGAAQGPEPVWSPFAAITGGTKMVQSVETSPGIKQLLAGGSAAGSQVLSRSLTTFTDNGTPYDATFTMGSIMLAHPGQMAILKFLEFDFSGVAYKPTISYLLNEISGSFTSFTNGTGVPVFDPPEIYGDTITPSSYSPNRYYFSSTASLARCRHMQVKVDFGTTSNGDEMYSMTIFGRLTVE